MLRIEDIRELSRPSGTHSILAIVTDWIFIVGCFALASHFANPLVWIFCYVFVARQQLALAIIMHDGAHRRLFKSARWNDYVCQFFCAAPLFFSMYSYQKLHLKHHRAPLAPDDPDLSLIGGYPISKGSLVRKLARDAFGISYLKFIRYFIHMARRPQAKIAKIEADAGPIELKAQASGNRMGLTMIVFSILAMNIVLWGALFFSGHGWLYLIFWVLPAVTALQVLLRIRGIAEDAGYQSNIDQRMNARTVLNPLQTFLFAPHNVAFHIEHHVYPAVPFYNLRKLHRLMMAEGLIPPQNLFRGYGKVLADLIL